jgi:hypothetical protein
VSILRINVRKKPTEEMRQQISSRLLSKRICESQLNVLNLLRISFNTPIKILVFTLKKEEQNRR